MDRNEAYDVVFYATEADLVKACEVCLGTSNVRENLGEIYISSDWGQYSDEYFLDDSCEEYIGVAKAIKEIQDLRAFHTETAQKAQQTKNIESLQTLLKLVMDKIEEVKGEKKLPVVEPPKPQKSYMARVFDLITLCWVAE